MRILPFSRKAERFITRSPKRDSFINILTGSIRSSKTTAMMMKLLGRLNRYEVAGKRVIIGVSKQTVYNNVLTDLFDFLDHLGPGHYSYNRSSGELDLMGTKWLVIGAKDEGSEKYIRGMTVGIAYIDEATLVPQSFFLMLISRMSPEGARLYATTNPGTPVHYLKTDYLDNANLRARGDVWSENFILYDNPSLSTAKREQYEQMYTGMFYRRFILGEWVAAEGSIFGSSWSDANLFTDATRPVGLLGAGGFAERFYSIDYGTSNATCFLEWYDDGKTLWITREWYWDSAKRFQQLTDTQYADELLKFAGGISSKIILDPSALSFKVELRNRGFFVKDAKNDVLDGIRMTSAALANKVVRVHNKCEHLIAQIQSYAWDDKAAARGEEKPLKVNDHAVDPCRYGVATHLNQRRLAA